MSEFKPGFQAKMECNCCSFTCELLSLVKSDSTFLLAPPTLSDIFSKYFFAAVSVFNISYSILFFEEHSFVAGGCNGILDEVAFRF